MYEVLRSDFSRYGVSRSDFLRSEFSRSEFSRLLHDLTLGVSHNSYHK